MTSTVSSMEAPFNMAIGHAVAGLLLVFLIGKLCYSLFSRDFRLELPHVGEGKRRNGFSLRTRLRYYTDCKALFEDTYTQFSKQGKTCVIPGIGPREEVILPPSATNWVASQPRHAMSANDSLLDMNQFEYSLKDRKYVADLWHGLLVRTEMNRVLESLAYALDDEIPVALERYVGAPSNEWKALDPTAAMKLVVAQASSRFTVGLPLCREESYLRDSSRIVDLLALNAGIIGIFPKPLKPIVAPFVTMPLRYRMRKLRAAVAPLLQAEMHAARAAAGAAGDDPSSTAAGTGHPEPPPPTHLHMMVQHAWAKHPDEFNERDLLARLCLSNMGSYHQTAVAAANVLWNILGSDAADDTIAVLRAEMTRVAAAHGGRWSKQRAAQMVRTDSVLRETLRLHSFAGRAMLRRVMRDDVRMPDGTQLPRGAGVSVLAYGAQTDGDVYADPTRFDPFRFARAREAAAAASSSTGGGGAEKVHGGAMDDAGSTATANLAAADPNAQAFVSTGPHFLPFGHGKHSCPGRFILDVELKIILTHLLTRYDLKLPDAYHGRRPANPWLAEAVFPVTGGTILIRQRQSS